MPKILLADRKCAAVSVLYARRRRVGSLFPVVWDYVPVEENAAVLLSKILSSPGEKTWER